MVYPHATAQVNRREFDEQEDGDEPDRIQATKDEGCGRGPGSTGRVGCDRQRQPKLDELSKNALDVLRSISCATLGTYSGAMERMCTEPL